MQTEYVIQKKSCYSDSPLKWRREEEKEEEGGALINMLIHQRNKQNIYLFIYSFKRVIL